VGKRVNPLSIKKSCKGSEERAIVTDYYFGKSKPLLMAPSSPSRPYKPYSIAGQTALITGASSGIGQACAWRLAAEGCKLILLARRFDRLQLLEAAIRKEYDVPVHIVQLDVREYDAVAVLPDALPDGFKEVDILVNNAGLALGVDPVDALSMDEAQTMIDSNVTSVVAFTRAFVPGMRARDRGHIINMSSIAAHESYGGGSVYCATKHALDALTNAARHDLVGTRVRVTAISPGAVETEFSVVRFNGDQGKADAVYEGIEPLMADDIADNVAYAVTRPPHVQVAEILVFATYQASAKGLARVLKKD
jgi:3-hydroxy acid dehydrogenase / malonic semialdehyde reductase